ncbi:hypothetical protein [uncultured Methanolobus sp.]|uniref:hypothetical protein n=1 Tax=uncultured Methanolobus sp. TaxID=218300 RepID=UPI002AAB2971|nr:hypothetical protein [uncultured Methanolobus sp.]
MFSNRIRKAGIEIMSENQIIVPLARQLNLSQIATGSGSSPSDIIFQLTEEKYEVLRSRIVTPSSERDGWRYLPCVIEKRNCIPPKF